MERSASGHPSPMLVINIFIKTHSCVFIKIKGAMSKQGSPISACQYHHPPTFRVNIYRIYTSSRQCLRTCYDDNVNSVPQKYYFQSRSKLIPDLISSDPSVTFKVLFSNSLFLIDKVIKEGQIQLFHPNLSCMHTIQ